MTGRKDKDKIKYTVKYAHGKHQIDTHHILEFC